MKAFLTILSIFRVADSVLSASLDQGRQSVERRISDEVIRLVRIGRLPSYMLGAVQDLAQLRSILNAHPAVAGITNSQGQDINLDGVVDDTDRILAALQNSLAPAPAPAPAKPKRKR